MSNIPTINIADSIQQNYNIINNIAKKYALDLKNNANITILAKKIFIQSNKAHTSVVIKEKHSFRRVWIEGGFWIILKLIALLFQKIFCKNFSKQEDLNAANAFFENFKNKPAPTENENKVTLVYQVINAAVKNDNAAFKLNDLPWMSHVASPVDSSNVPPSNDIPPPPPPPPDETAPAGNFLSALKGKKLKATPKKTPTVTSTVTTTMSQKSSTVASSTSNKPSTTSTATLSLAEQAKLQREKVLKTDNGKETIEEKLRRQKRENAASTTSSTSTFGSPLRTPTNKKPESPFPSTSTKPASPFGDGIKKFYSPQRPNLSANNTNNVTKLADPNLSQILKARKEKSDNPS